MSLPAIIGYLNLHYNPDNERNLALELLKEILSYMLALGTGVGRATGFGHVTVL